MRLPGLTYADGLRKSTQVQFGGLDHRRGAGDGAIWAMENMTGDHYPLLSSRAPRTRLETLETGGGLFAWEELCWVDGTSFFYGGEERGQVTQGEKSFAALGAYIIILPDKAYYNVETEEFGSLEAEWTGESLTFTDGLLFEEEAKANTIQVEGVDWSEYFKAGDAVTIQGCSTHPENNKTPVIRKIDGDKLYFYEYIFTLEGEEGDTPYTETGALSIKRRVPDLLYLCENENRLWGCDRTTIYASKPGDPFNWNVFEGLSSDSYAVDTGSAGAFTGCVSYLGYPVFFKEDHIYKVYGSVPSNFQVMGSASLGVAEGSGRSLAVAGETLFYLSRAGVVAYSGGIPQSVGAVFGTQRYKNAVAGSDGLKYFVSMEDQEGTWTLYVYDTRLGLWHTEDHTRVTHFAYQGGALYFLNQAGEIWCAGGLPQGSGEGQEEAVDWWAEFADFTEGDPNKKGVERVQVRLELEEGAWAQVLVRFDSEEEWSQVGKVMDEGIKRSYILPIVPRRGDHYRLKIQGSGPCMIHSLTREYYAGSAEPS